jgi:hypothetical protein
MKDTNEIINFEQFRSRKQEEKKRKTERIFFHNLVGIYGMVGPSKMVPVELMDVSEEGLGIQVPYDSEKVWPRDSENVTIRLYFSAESYMEIAVDIRNTRPMIDGGFRYVRYGCEVRSGQRSYEAWTKFVGFLKSFSEVSEKDSGNVSVGSI